MEYRKILLPTGSASPLRTAARELAAGTGATVEERPATAGPGAGEIALAVGEAARMLPGARERLEGVAPGREWELVQETGGGLLIAGNSPRNACRAALLWLSAPRRWSGVLSVFDLKERFTMWDNTLNQWYRHSRGFDKAAHIRELARLGHTGVEVNRYLDPRGWHVRNRRFPNDSYAWYMNYCPALDAFVESSLIAGFYPAEELRRNLEDLKESAALARSYGMVPGFVAYEPRGVNERIFDRYPQLRGSRIDHPGRSLEPRYALDIAHPQVLEHYAEMVERLLREVPDLRYLQFWTSDSGSGLPFARNLYFGPNGSYLAKAKSLEQMAAEFSGALLEGGRRVNPEFEVLMEMSWEYHEDERRAITAALPPGVTLSHSTGQGIGILDGQEPTEENRTRFGDDRAAGKNPYGEITISSSWDFEPVFGIPYPAMVAAKLATVRALGLDRCITRGGINSPPQCPWNVNHEVYARLLGAPEGLPVKPFLQEVAAEWCAGDQRQAELLVSAWLNGERAVQAWPVLNWYQAGAAMTQGRWLTRPLVPDFALLTPQERAAFDRAVFTLEWDVARLNLAFEGGLRFYSEERMEQAAASFDQSMLPLLKLTVSILDQALALGERPVLRDQRDRYHGLLLHSRTVRNSFAAQAAINRWLLEPERRPEQRRLLDQTLAAELKNTEDWLAALENSRTNFFRVTELDETPFLYKTPLEDLRLRLEVMRRHREDQPGPDLPELRATHDERSAWRLRD